MTTFCRWLHLLFLMSLVPVEEKHPLQLHHPHLHQVTWTKLPPFCQQVSPELYILCTTKISMIFFSLARNPPNPLSLSLSLSTHLYKRTLPVGSSLIPHLNLKCYWTHLCRGFVVLLLGSIANFVRSLSSQPILWSLFTAARNLPWRGMLLNAIVSRFVVFNIKVILWWTFSNCCWRCVKWI